MSLGRLPAAFLGHSSLKENVTHIPLGDGGMGFLEMIVITG